ncbi:MAG: hypothetical protein H7X86_08190 [Gorillibacterium sp.]|nr:hypothetical protein [Gorillibacterium sp.]
MNFYEIDAWLFKLLPYSLKRRISLLLRLCAIIPLLLMASVSYFSIRSVLENKIEKGVQSNLKQTKNGVERMFQNMDYTSRQFALNGIIGEKLERYLTTQDRVEKSDLYEQIYKNMVLLNFNNPETGLVTYWLPQSKSILFETQHVKDVLDLGELPVLAN